MLEFIHVSKKSELFDYTIKDLIDFLYRNLEQFCDSPKAIRECLEYALSQEKDKGGTIIYAKDGNKLVGCVVVTHTGMKDFLPENFLVYIAVSTSFRGKGIGSKLLKDVIDSTKGNIALHVEHNNPAQKLYTRLGFTSKYLEMHFNK